MICLHKFHNYKFTQSYQCYQQQMHLAMQTLHYGDMMRMHKLISKTKEMIKERGPLPHD